VVIQDVRRGYGRTDALIHPIAGTGEAWVRAIDSSGNLFDTFRLEESPPQPSLAVAMPLNRFLAGVRSGDLDPLDYVVDDAGARKKT
jgi:hypothetical protein